MTTRPIAARHLRAAASDADPKADQHSVCAAHAVAQGRSDGIIFIDEAVSGVVGDRSALRGLVNCTRERGAAIVVTANASRLSRDSSTLEDLEETCEALRAQVPYTGETGSTEGLIRRLFAGDAAKGQQGADRRAMT